MILLDVGASWPDRVAVLAEALAAQDVEALYLPPAVRERLHRARRNP